MIRMEMSYNNTTEELNSALAVDNLRLHQRRDSPQ